MQVEELMTFYPISKIQLLFRGTGFPEPMAALWLRFWRQEKDKANRK